MHFRIFHFKLFCRFLPAFHTVEFAYPKSLPRRIFKTLRRLPWSFSEVPFASFIIIFIRTPRSLLVPIFVPIVFRLFWLVLFPFVIGLTITFLFITTYTITAYGCVPFHYNLPNGAFSLSYCSKPPELSHTQLPYSVEIVFPQNEQTGEFVSDPVFRFRSCMLQKSVSGRGTF